MKSFNILLILFLFCIVFQSCSDSSDNKIASQNENLNDTFRILEAILDTFQQSKNANNINPYNPYKDTLIICYDSLYFTPLRHFKKGKYVFLTEDQICNLVTDMDKRGVLGPFPKTIKIPVFKNSTSFKIVNNKYTICVEMFSMSPNFDKEGKPYMTYGGELYKGKEKCTSYTNVTFCIDMIKNDDGEIKFLKMDKTYD